MLALGFPVFPYRLVAFTMAGAIGGLAGALSVNQSGFVSPAMMHWVQSGDLIVMVVLGGISTLFGPIYGAVAYLMLEHFLSSWTENWELVFGPLIVLLVLFARGGLDAVVGMLPGESRTDAKGTGHA
jgi:branched-chain amino acid transport system permease protein